MLGCRDANCSSSTFPPVYELLRRSVLILIVSCGSINRKLIDLLYSELRTSSSDPTACIAAGDTEATVVSARPYLPSIITYHVN